MKKEGRVQETLRRIREAIAPRDPHSVEREKLRELNVRIQVAAEKIESAYTVKEKAAP